MGNYEKALQLDPKLRHAKIRSTSSSHPTAGYSRTPPNPFRGQRPGRRRTPWFSLGLAHSCAGPAITPVKKFVSARVENSCAGAWLGKRVDPPATGDSADRRDFLEYSTEMPCTEAKRRNLSPQSGESPSTTPICGCSLPSVWLMSYMEICQILSIMTNNASIQSMNVLCALRRNDHPYSSKEMGQRSSLAAGITPQIPGLNHLEAGGMSKIGFLPSCRQTLTCRVTEGLPVIR